MLFILASIYALLSLREVLYGPNAVSAKRIAKALVSTYGSAQDRTGQSVLGIVHLVENAHTERESKVSYTFCVDRLRYLWFSRKTVYDNWGEKKEHGRFVRLKTSLPPSPRW